MNNILITGTGALATLFAARLTQAKYQVTMLGTWREGIHALNTDGARLVDSTGKEKSFSVHATSDPRECINAKHTIVLVKAWQTERVAHQLKECLAEDGLALTLQNGLGNRETLSQILDKTTSEVSSDFRSLKPSRVALGSTTTGATLLGPGLVKAGGEGVISLERNQALGPIEEALRSAGFNLQSVDDAQSLIWGKLVVNAAINPLTALLRVKNGELLERPFARELMEALAHETADVAHAENIALPFDDPIAKAEDVAHKTAANTSSMLQDVLRGAPTEIDAICGAVVRTAAKHGIGAPVNWTCWQLVKALEKNPGNS
jgi:2-dehydropantoate 2-reductase